MNQPKRTFYSHLGPEGLKKLAKEYSVNNDLPFVLKEINEGDKVLDLACGYGRITIPLAEANINVTGIDLDKKLIQDARFNAKKHHLKIKFDVGNMTKLPYKNDSFNKIFCLWNSFTELLTLTDQNKALTEMYRVLKMDSQALLILPNGDGKVWREAIKNNNEQRVISSILHNQVERQYIHDHKSLESLLNTTPFKKSEIRYINMHKRRRMFVRLFK